MNSLPYGDLEKGKCQAEGVYPGSFEAQAEGCRRGVSKLYFQYLHPCQNREDARACATWYLKEHYLSVPLVFMDNPELRAKRQFYVLFERKDQ